MARRLPLGAPEARALGLIDDHAGPGRGDVSRAHRARAAELAQTSVRASPGEKRDGAGARRAGAPLADYRARRARAHAHEFLRLRSELSHRASSVRLPHAARLDAAASGPAPPRGVRAARAGECMSTPLDDLPAAARAGACGAALAHRRPRAGRGLPTVRLSPRAPAMSSPAGCATTAVRSRSMPRVRRNDCGLSGTHCCRGRRPRRRRGCSTRRPAVLRVAAMGSAFCASAGGAELYDPRAGGPVHLR